MDLLDVEDVGKELLGAAKALRECGKACRVALEGLTEIYDTTKDPVVREQVAQTLDKMTRALKGE